MAGRVGGCNEKNDEGSDQADNERYQHREDRVDSEMACTMRACNQPNSLDKECRKRYPSVGDSRSKMGLVIVPEVAEPATLRDSGACKERLDFSITHFTGGFGGN
jgi:hypothetical protein